MGKKKRGARAGASDRRILTEVRTNEEFNDFIFKLFEKFLPDFNADDAESKNNLEKLSRIFDIPAEDLLSIYKEQLRVRQPKQQEEEEGGKQEEEEEEPQTAKRNDANNLQEHHHQLKELADGDTKPEAVVASKQQQAESLPLEGDNNNSAILRSNTTSSENAKPSSTASSNGDLEQQDTSFCAPFLPSSSDTARSDDLMGQQQNFRLITEIDSDSCCSSLDSLQPDDDDDLSCKKTNEDTMSDQEVNDDDNTKATLVHIGSASLPRGTKFSLDSFNSSNSQRRRLQISGGGERQRKAVQAMAEAFRRPNDDIERLPSQPMDEAALSLELERWMIPANAADAADSEQNHQRTTRSNSNAAVIMSTQRWVIVNLPIVVVRQIIRVAKFYREALEVLLPLDTKPPPSNHALPDPKQVFPHMLRGVTEETRPDAVALLNYLFRVPKHVNCHVYSEQDDQLEVAWRGFVRSPFSKTLKELSLHSSASEILNYTSTTTRTGGAIDSSVCFWCEKTALSCSEILSCSLCDEVSYCSKNCQYMDWYAFHKTKECKRLKKGKMTVEDSRLATIEDNCGTARETPAMTFPVALPEDEGSVWRGDCLLFYLSKKADLWFPRGVRLLPREDKDGQKKIPATISSSTPEQDDETLSLVD